MKVLELRTGVDRIAFAGVDADCFATSWPAQSFLTDEYHLGCGVWVEAKCVAYAYGRALQGEGELHRIATRPRFRGRGYGTQILRAFSDICRGAGVCRLFLEVNRQNAAAVRLYLNQGFCITSERRDYYGAGDHAVVMVQTLEA